MLPQEIFTRLKSQFGESILELKVDGVVDPFVKASSKIMREASEYLRDDPELQFDYLMCLSGMDYGKGILGVVYHVASTVKRHKLTIRVEVPADNAELPSVEPVWQSANWHEREAFDMFGIMFAGHPDLRRILLPDDYPGHPLRKDFKVPEYYQGMKVPY